MCGGLPAIPNTCSCRVRRCGQWGLNSEDESYIIIYFINESRCFVVCPAGGGERLEGHGWTFYQCSWGGGTFLPGRLLSFWGDQERADEAGSRAELGGLPGTGRRDLLFYLARASALGTGGGG